MRSFALVLACLACTCHASKQGSSSQALAELLTSKKAKAPPKESMVDKLGKIDEHAIAVALFDAASLVLVAYDLNTNWDKVVSMDKELTVDNAIVAGKFLLALNAMMTTANSVLPLDVFPDMVTKFHETEVAEVLLVTVALVMAYKELAAHWDNIKAMEKEFKASAAVTVSKFLKTLQKTLKTTKKAVASYKSVR